MLSVREITLGIGGRMHGERGRARCPAHGGPRSRPDSLSIAERDGRVLVKCHRGCAQADVIAALRDRGLWPAARPLTFRERTLRLVRAIDRQAKILDAERRYREGLARDAAAWSSTCTHWRTEKVVERVIPTLALARLAALTGPDLGGAIDEAARLQKLPPDYIRELVRRHLDRGAP